MRGAIKVLVVAGAMFVAPLGAAGTADAAIVTSQASLVNGQLTIVGSGAVPGSNVTVDNFLPTGQADAQGDFSISASGFSEPSCVATLFDGSVSVEVTLTGCTPTISRPPVVPGPPSPVGPPPGASVTEPVTLSWQPPAHTPGVNYQWEVSTRRDFATQALTETTSPKVTSAALSGLAPGTYYWRVQSVSFPPEPYFPLFGNWTRVRSLTITGEAPGAPGTPALTAPATGSEFHPEETFPLTWTTAAGAASYRLQLANRATFAPGTLLADVPESATAAQAPLFGFQTRLFARVFAVAADGTLGLPSPAVALKITFQAPVPAAPSLLAPPDAATVTLPVALSWTPDPNPQAEGYQLEINSKPRFAGGCGEIEECVTGLSQPGDTLASLPAGTHYWRVRSFHGLAGPDREAATGWSAARSFTVSDAPPAVGSLTIDVFTEGGVVLRSHTHVFSGTNEDNEAFGLVQLTTPAPRGGASITLASSDPAVAAIKPSVTVPAGHAQATFSIQPGQVPQPAAVTLSATLNGQAATAPLIVAPASLNQVYIGSNQKEDGRSVPNIFSGGTSQVGNLLFNGNAPSGSVVTLASSSPAASVPASVTAAGQGVAFTISTSQVTASTPVVITATWRGRTVMARMTLQPPPTLETPATGTHFAAGHVVIVRWHTPAGLSSELQVADNRAFKNPLTDFNTDTAQAWALSSLPSGKLFWRVLGVDVYGADGPPSAVNTLIIREPGQPPSR
jgi:hypothetical protein